MDEHFLVLHGLLVKQAGAAADVAAILGIDEATVSPILEEEAAAGRVLSGRGTYMLSPAGRLLLEGGYGDQCAALRDNSEFVSSYERFEVINRKLLDLFTRWQTLPSGIENDHSDTAYDHGIIDELGDIDERAGRLFAILVAIEPRYEVYARRLAAAYDRVLAGDTAYVSAVRIDSYHTVWFQLHEDLLRVLGRQRDA